MVKVYLKSEDEPKDNKIKCKNLNLAWLHIENQEYLSELYNLGFIYFDIVGKKETISGFEFTTKNFKKTYYDISSKYFNFLKDICEKFVYKKYSSEIGYFKRFIKYDLEDKYATIEIEVRFDRTKIHTYDVNILKNYYEKLNLMVDDEIPIKRDEGESSIIILNNEKFNEDYNKNYVYDLSSNYGYIISIEPYLNDKSKLFYKYQNKFIFNCIIQNSDIMKFQFKKGVKVYLKGDKFKSFDYIEQSKRPLEFIEDFKPYSAKLKGVSTNLNSYI